MQNQSKSRLDFSQLTNSINTRFYGEVFETWNNQDDYYWPGFWDLYPFIDQVFKKIEQEEKRSVFKVIDLGCANGRFLNFLEFVFPEYKFIKTGIDFVDFKMVNDTNFVKLDLTSEDFKTWVLANHKQYDLVTLFGVYHHIQGQHNRDQLTSNIINLMSDNALYVFTRWNFLTFPRLKKHIVFRDDLQQIAIDHPSFSNIVNQISLNYSNFEFGDYILKWNKIKFGLRFANYMDQLEIQIMIDKQGLKIVTQFDADDKTDNRNSYFVCQKTQIISLSNIFLTIPKLKLNTPMTRGW
jgi:SAM-dependent methyltransferase